MRTITRVSICLLIASLVFLPTAAEAHRQGGQVFWGFGVGLLTGYLFAPRTVVVAPPAVVAPAPVYRAPYVPAPTASPVYRYSNSAPRPDANAKCREWRLIERYHQDSWDAYAGKWRSTPVEKWGWVEVPCGS